MESVKLSEKYQIVIRLKIRKKMGLKPGLIFQVISYDDRIELIPVLPMVEMRGFLKGFDSHFDRDREDRV